MTTPIACPTCNVLIAPQGLSRHQGSEPCLTVADIAAEEAAGRVAATGHLRTLLTASDIPGVLARCGHRSGFVGRRSVTEWALWVDPVWVTLAACVAHVARPKRITILRAIARDKTKQAGLLARCALAPKTPLSRVEINALVAGYEVAQ
jgi:hypothetical protein